MNGNYFNAKTHNIKWLAVDRSVVRDIVFLYDMDNGMGSGYSGYNKVKNCHFGAIEIHL